MVLLLVLIEHFESFDGFVKGARISLSFFGCLVNNLVQIMKADERNYRTDQMLMKGPGLPEAEAEPEIMVLFFLAFGVEGETIGAGLLHWFAAVHSFVEDEKGERASHLVGAVSGDFLHIG
ncbi:MAG: hypothetical protein WCI92_06620 [Bacteroidota bacterium]